MLGTCPLRICSRFAMMLLVFTTHLLQAQNQNISGTVFSGATHTPVSQAEIFLRPGNYGTTTNEAGYFQFTGVPSGKYEIFVKHLGCNDYSKTIQLNTGENPELKIYLQPDIRTIEGIEVFEESLEQEPYVTQQISGKTIQRLPARDVGEFIRSEPNVSGIRKGGGNIDPVIRGFKFAQLNVQNNTGLKIEGGCPNRMDPAASHIDVNDISRIEILKGPYALRYGPSFGGVLNLVTEKARPFEKFSVQLRAVKGWETNWNGDKEHITVLGGNRNIYFAITGNHHKYGNYSAGNGREIKSSFRKYNYAFELGLSPWQHHELRLNFKESFGRDIRFPALPMDEREDNTRLMSANYRFLNPGKKVRSIHAKIYRSAVNHEMDNKWRPFSDTVVAISTIDALNQGGRIDLGLKTRKGILHTGLDFEQILKDGRRVKNLILQPGLPQKTEDLWSNARIENLGLFAEYKFELNQKWDIVTSGRLDFNSASSDPMQLLNMAGGEMYSNDSVNSDFTNLSLSAGIIYKPSESWKLSTAVGRGVRNPDMVERFIILLPIGYDNYDYLGNPQLKPENNHQADLTLEFSHPQAGLFKANGFLSLVTDYITGIKLPPSQIMPQTKDVLGVKEFQNIDKAWLYGFEFTWHSPAGYQPGGSLTAAYTAGTNPEAVKYIVENGQVVGSEIVKNDPLPEIPPLEVNLKLHYRMLENTLVPEIRIRMVAAQNRVSQAFDEQKTPGFVIAGFNTRYDFNDILTVAAGVNNIFDKAYYEHLNRRIIGSREPLFEPGRIFYLNLILNI